jgi:uncharacterized protein YciI
MRIVALFSWIAALALLTTAPQALAEDAVPSSKQTYLVVYKRGPAWVGNTLAEQSLQAHGKYMLDLYERGAMKFAGPFLDDAGGAVVLEVNDDAEAKAIVANDPAVKQGTFVADIHPWLMQPWETFLQKRREREAK